MAKSDPQVIQRLRDAQDDLWKVDPQNASFYEDALVVYDNEEAARDIQHKFLLPPTTETAEEDQAAMALLDLGNSNHAGAYVQDEAVNDTLILHPFNPKTMAETELPRLKELDAMAQQTRDIATTNASLATQRDIEGTTASNDSNTIPTTETTDHDSRTTKVPNDVAPKATTDNEAALALLGLVYSGSPHDYVNDGIPIDTPALRYLHSVTFSVVDFSSGSHKGRASEPVSPRTICLKGNPRVSASCASEKPEAPDDHQKSSKSTARSVSQSVRKPRIRLLLPTAASSTSLMTDAEQPTKPSKTPAPPGQRSIKQSTVLESQRKLRNPHQSPGKTKGKAPAHASPGAASSDVRTPATSLRVPLKTAAHRRCLRSSTSKTADSVGSVEAPALPPNKVTAIQRSKRKAETDQEGEMTTPACKKTRAAQETLQKSSASTPARSRLLRCEDSDDGEEDIQSTPINNKSIKSKPKPKITSPKSQCRAVTVQSPAVLPTRAPPNTAGIPNDALALNEFFKKDHPCSLGVQLPIDRARTRWEWGAYVSRKTGNAQFDWGNEIHVRDVNRWRQQRIRRRLTEHGVVRDGRKHND